jgi:hypothetical protein
MKVYITQYALTKGILEREVEPSNTNPTLVRLPHSVITYHKPHWHEGLAIAQMQAEIMRKRKILSLEKELNRLKNLSFK